MGYWLLKSEPSIFSIDDLLREPRKTTSWEGVRNYQARNFLRDEIKKGDHAFFYHSNCDMPGIAGLLEVAREGYPDPLQWDKSSRYYDPAASPDNPRWYTIEVRLIRKFIRVISLPELRGNRKLGDMFLLRKGNRLSVMPVAEGEWEAILAME